MINLLLAIIAVTLSYIVIPSETGSLIDNPANVGFLFINSWGVFLQRLGLSILFYVLFRAMKELYQYFQPLN